jgi:catalase (peroxidase I)
VAESAEPAGSPPAPRPGPTRWARTFSYAEEFKTLDVEALKRDIIELMTTA